MCGDKHQLTEIQPPKLTAGGSLNTADLCLHTITPREKKKKKKTLPEVYDLSNPMNLTTPLVRTWKLVIKTVHSRDSLRREA